MRIIAAAASAIMLIVEGSSPALSQPATTSTAQPVKPLAIEGLAMDWKTVEYELAENSADGITDNSAPRATMRAVQD